MSDNVHALRSPKGKAEVHQHRIARAAFLSHVIADPRTRRLFEWWEQRTGVADVVERMAALLQAAAHSAGLAHRRELRQRTNAPLLVPILGPLQHLEAEYTDILTKTETERAREAEGFVVAVLYKTTDDAQVPIRRWLARDLLTVFQWEIAAHVYDDVVPLGVPLSATVDADVPAAAKPKREGAHLQMYAGWYYRARVAEIRATVADLAEEYRAAQDAAGQFLAPKDQIGFDLRADTKLVRYGIEEAQRLLELPVPPEQWDFSQYFHGLLGEKQAH